MTRKYRAKFDSTSNGVVTIEPVNLPEKAFVVGRIVARVWRNERPLGTERKIDCVYVRSEWKWGGSMPLDAVADAIKAMAKAHKWAKRQERGRWLAIFLLRW
jgi:hypothetical protein